MATGLDWFIVIALTIAAFVPENSSCSIRAVVRWSGWIERLFCVCGVCGGCGGCGGCFDFLDVGRNEDEDAYAYKIECRASASDGASTKAANRERISEREGERIASLLSIDSHS